LRRHMMAIPPAIRELSAEYLIGIAPLASARSGLSIRDHLPGSIIPDAVVDRLARAKDPTVAPNASCWRENSGSGQCAQSAHVLYAICSVSAPVLQPTTAPRRTLHVELKDRHSIMAIFPFELSRRMAPRARLRPQTTRHRLKSRVPSLLLANGAVVSSVASALH
jgi:hypothetical protein